eukprot:SAG31_NODE_258_length_18937_cov_61.688555_25_plen_88_part_00
MLANDRIVLSERWRNAGGWDNCTERLDETCFLFKNGGEMGCESVDVTAMNGIVRQCLRAKHALAGGRGGSLMDRIATTNKGWCCQVG